jgi:hypothetical protein
VHLVVGMLHLDVRCICLYFGRHRRAVSSSCLGSRPVRGRAEVVTASSAARGSIAESFFG